MGGDVCVLDVHRIFDLHAFDQLGGVARGGDGGTAAKSLEDRFFNGLVFFVDLDLEFHDISTRGCSYETRSNIALILIHRAHISWVLVVVDDSCIVGEHSDRGALKHERPEARSHSVSTFQHGGWLLL